MNDESEAADQQKTSVHRYLLIQLPTRYDEQRSTLGPLHLKSNTALRVSTDPTASTTRRISCFMGVLPMLK
jgi:hypothetical protein